MEKIEITREHCKLMGDFFINSGMEAKKLEYVISDMKNYLGDKNAGDSIAYALQKAGLGNAFFAGAVAKELLGLDAIAYIEYSVEKEKEEKLKEALKLIEKQK